MEFHLVEFYSNSLPGMLRHVVGVVRVHVLEWEIRGIGGRRLQAGYIQDIIIFTSSFQHIKRQS
jgi:hypothetical protein